MVYKGMFGQRGLCQVDCWSGTTKKIGRRWQRQIKVEYGGRKVYEGQKMEVDSKKVCFSVDAE